MSTWTTFHIRRNHFHILFFFVVITNLIILFSPVAHASCKYKDVKSCRMNKCYWSCTGGGCSYKANECSANPECAKLCHQPCECRQKGCEYNSVGDECRPGGVACTDFSLNAAAMEQEGVLLQECARPDVYYAAGGYICKNKKSRGACGIEAVINAINFNGNELADHRGILYYSEYCDSGDHCGYQDDWQTVEGGEAHGAVADHAQDAPIFKTYIAGKEFKKGTNVKGKCIILPISIRDVGCYEVCLMIADFVSRKIGDRNFDIYLDEGGNDNRYVIAKGFDPFVYNNGESKRGIDLCFNIVVQNIGGKKKFVIPGYTWTHFHLDCLQLMICYGDCAHSKNHGYIISAYSVVKFKDD